MKKGGLLFLCAVMLRGAAFGAETKPSGWLSLDYLQGQSQSSFAHGSIQNFQAGLMVSGTTEGKFTFSLEARARGVSKIEVEQAWAGFFSSAAFRVRVGLYLVPFGKYNAVNRPSQTVLVSDPMHLDMLFPLSWRDLGVVMEGQTKLFSYSAYVGNGLGEGSDLKPAQQFRDNNKDKALGTRLGIFLSDNFEIGASYYQGKYDNGNRRQIVLKGADLSWFTRDYYVLAEYTRSEADNPAPLDKGEAENFFVQFSMDYGSLKPVVSYQKYQRNDAFGGLSRVDAISVGPALGSKGTRWSLGFVYLLSPSVLFKAEYDINNESNLKLKNNVFLAQLALQF